MPTIALNFHGPINHPATTKLRNALCQIVNDQQRFDSLILLMNSTGGPLDDGFSLYGFLKSLPIKVTTVNTGLIASIANVPFLAGEYRIACPHARFHFHDFDWTYAGPHVMTRPQYADHTQLLESARETKKELLKLHTSLTDADFEKLKLLDQPIIKDAAFAKEKGIVQEIGWPKIPAGTTIFNVDY